MTTNIKDWYKSGAPWIWLVAGAVSVSLLMVFGVLALTAARGLTYFWPATVVQLEYQTADGPAQRLVGEIQDSEEVPAARVTGAGVQLPDDSPAVVRHLLKTGNRDIFGSDFRWILQPFVVSREAPSDLVVIERREWGNFYGYLVSVKENGALVAEGDEAWSAFQTHAAATAELHQRIKQIEKDAIGDVNYAIEQLRLTTRGLELEGELTPAAQADIEQQHAVLSEEFAALERELNELYQEIERNSYVVETMDGRQVELPFSKVVRAFKPNSMSLLQKVGHYFEKLWEFVSDEPREANTEGGIFPAIFGTVLMVMLMSIIVTPLGVIAAVYLREYAKQGFITRLIRIAVNNLAGVPSIVYGLFGLGFFVYFLGGTLDQLFYPEALPAPTFGTGGIIWASLTLSILTLPVVIVATEEGLSRIPRAIREGSLALGATKAETLWRTVIPMASPAIMTGLILAVARAAGEVAPLMLVGVVKLAPSLPLDSNAPFLHLDRKFMHLGFHIYDVGFQSPNVEAARPLVYATALLLVVVIMVLNLAAITIRNHLREKYRNLES